MSGRIASNRTAWTEKFIIRNSLVTRESCVFLLKSPHCRLRACIESGDANPLPSVPVDFVPVSNLLTPTQLLLLPFVAGRDECDLIENVLYSRYP